MTDDFASSWTVRTDGGQPEAIILPHDGMISRPRSADAPGGAHNAWFPGARYRYERTWMPPADADDRYLALFFEGVQGAVTVRVDGREVSSWRSGYREVEVPLTGLVREGVPVRLEVDVDHTAVPDARWYTGSGIYRDLSLWNLPCAHIVRGQVRTEFSFDDDTASLHVSALLSLDVRDSDEVTVRLLDGHNAVASAATTGAPGRAAVALTLDRPRLWSDEDPYLYTLEIALRRDGAELDVLRERTGLRTVTVDARHGLRVNGRTVLLRGACLHHDNGVIGATTLRTAEYRRARLLKEAGYNAIRSAHNPLSRHLLDACDELGLYVVDELTDVWFLPKTAHDGADRFDETWPDDARSMVAKDHLHPSVIMYSIGNENHETSTERGVRVAEEITAFVHEVDRTRPVTTAINFMLNAVSKADGGPAAPPPVAVNPERAPSALTSTMINILANRLGALTQWVARLPSAERNTAGIAAAVDVVGYNYARGRYRTDARRHPDRVILGSESLSGELPRIWRDVEALPAVIGDFAWTGWDYLGEAGIGSWVYDAGPRRSLLMKEFPHLVADPGAIDITGVAGAPVALQKAVWGLLDAPAIMVRPLDVAGARVQKTVWRASDASASWSWRGYEGVPAEIEVYSDADEVELLLNGRSLGRRRAGVRADYVARFRTPYEPGELVAVGYRHGLEIGRSVLRSAGATQLRLRVEASYPGDDAAFVWAEFADPDGLIESAASAEITLEIENAQLVGFGSADPTPSSNASFTDHVHHAYRGQALAILRSDASASPPAITARSGGSVATTIVNWPRAEREVPFESS